MTTEPQPPPEPVVDLLAALERAVNESKADRRLAMAAAAAARAATVSVDSDFLGTGYWLDVDGIAIHNPDGGNWASPSEALAWWDAHGAEWMGGLE